jgi:crotonyl-CoA reductase
MKQGDVVLIWGATGGIGAYATQYVLNGGGIPGVRGVVAREGGDPAQDGRRAHHRPCRCRLPVLRREHPGRDRVAPPGQGHPRPVRRGPDIVFEHPGRSTFGASMYVVKRGGTVVTCAATSGFMMEFDNRHFWMR